MPLSLGGRGAMTGASAGSVARVLVNTRGFRYADDDGYHAAVRQALDDPAFVSAVLVRALNRYVLPAVKRKLPTRSGRLKNGLKVVQVGIGIELKSVVHYAAAVTWDNGNMTVKKLFRLIYQQNRARIAYDVAAALRRRAAALIPPS